MGSLCRLGRGGRVSYFIDVPVEGGGRLLVEAAGWQVPGELELAAARPGEVIAQARESLEHSLDQLKPALTAVAGRLRAMSPDKFTVEFGLTLGAESGFVVAKGSGEVHFAVTLSWRKEAERELAGHPSAGANGHG